MRSHRRQRPGRGGRPAGIARGPGGPKDLRAAESRVRIPIPKGPNPTTFFKDNFLTSRIWSSCKIRSVHLTRCAGIILQLAQLLQVKKLSSKNPILVRIPHGATPGLVLVQFPIRGGVPGSIPDWQRSERAGLAAIDFGIGSKAIGLKLDSFFCSGHTRKARQVKGPSRGTACATWHTATGLPVQRDSSGRICTPSYNSKQVKR